MSNKTTPHAFFRFIFDKQYPGNPKCIQLNQIELYGDLVSSNYISPDDQQNDDESISIIG